MQGKLPHWAWQKKEFLSSQQLLLCHSEDSFPLFCSPCLIDCECPEGRKRINRWPSQCSFTQQKNFWVNSQWVKVVPPLHSSISLFTLDLHLLRPHLGASPIFVISSSSMLWPCWQLKTRRYFICAGCLSDSHPRCASCIKLWQGSVLLSCLIPSSRITCWEGVGMRLVPFPKWF